MDLRYNLGYIYIYLYDYEENNLHFAHSRMDQHIFHFYMLWWSGNLDLSNTRTGDKSHTDCLYVPEDMYI